MLETSVSKPEAPASDSNIDSNVLTPLTESKTSLLESNADTTSSAKALSKSNSSVTSMKTNETNNKKESIDKETKSVSSSINEKKDEPNVIELDEDSGDYDDFKKKTTPAKSSKALDDKEKRASSSSNKKSKVEKAKDTSKKDDDDDDDGEPREEVDKEKKKKPKKKALKLSDSEEDEFKPNKNKISDEENDFKGDDDDEDFGIKKKTKKPPSTKKKTSPDDKEKTTKKKVDKENLPETNLASSKPQQNESVNEKPFVVTPFTSKTVKQTSITSNATSTPDINLLINEKSTTKSENKPVNKFLANASLMNTSSTNSSPLGRIEIKTPSFARVGLSRNSKVKPLHPNAKLN
jgi:hypothetical protein